MAYYTYGNTLIPNTTAKANDVKDEFVKIETAFANLASVFTGGSGAKVDLSAAQTVADTSNDEILWDNESRDTHDIHAPVYFKQRLTVPSGVSVVCLKASVSLVPASAPTSTAACTLAIHKNGSAAPTAATLFSLVNGAVVVQTFNIDTSYIDVSPGDYFVAKLKNQCGVSVNIGNTALNSYFAMELLK